MNIRKLLLGITLCLASQLLVAQNHEAVKYNNRVIKEQHSVTPLIVSFFHNHFKKHIAPEVIKKRKRKNRIQA